MKTQLTKIASIACLAFTAAIVAAQQITVKINDQKVEFLGTQPKMRGDRVLVPLRGVFEQMGATVQWNKENQSVYAQKGNKSVRLRIGANTARVDDHNVDLDVPAQMIGGRTMVPIRFISETLGAQVGWNDNAELVSITTTDEMNQRPERIETTTTTTTATAVTGMRVFHSGTIIPVQLNIGLSSETSQRGDVFSAEVLPIEGVYSDFPKGSRITGHVLAVRPKSGSEPGVIELSFDDVKTSGGRGYPLSASLSSVYSHEIPQGRSTTETQNMADAKAHVFVGLGAGEVLIVGLTSHEPLDDRSSVGIRGFISDNIDTNLHQAKNVILVKGTRFGVRLEKAFSFPRN